LTKLVKSYAKITIDPKQRQLLSSLPVVTYSLYHSHRNLKKKTRNTIQHPNGDKHTDEDRIKNAPNNCMLHAIFTSIPWKGKGFHPRKQRNEHDDEEGGGS